MLSLKGITLLMPSSISGNSKFPNQYAENRAEVVQETLASLADYIYESRYLQHIDLSFMGLQENLVLLCDAISDSYSLLSAHLGENYIS